MLTVTGADPALLRGQWRNLFIMVWMASATVREMDLVYRDLKTLTTLYPHGVAVLSILETGAKPPDQQARQVIIKQQADLAPHLIGTAHLVDGQGFWASLMLTALVSMYQARRKRFEEQVFRSQRVVSEWLRPRIDDPEQTVTPEEIFEVISLVRAEARKHRKV